jgi:hypothetical protein
MLCNADVQMTLRTCVYTRRMSAVEIKYAHCRAIARAWTTPRMTFLGTILLAIISEISEPYADTAIDMYIIRILWSPITFIKQIFLTGEYFERIKGLEIYT